MTQSTHSLRKNDDQRNKSHFEPAWLRKWKRQRWRKRLESTADYYQFGREVFGLLQIESEITGLVERMKAILPVVVCEIGARSCGTSFMMSQAVPTVKTIIGLDLEFSGWKKMYDFSRSGMEIKNIAGSSYDPATVKKVEELLAGRSIDMLFIDGDHSYEGVTKDFLCYRHLVRDGGLIGFHDIVPDHKTRFGKTDTAGYAGGVPILWSHLKQRYDHNEYINNPEQDGCGIGVLTYATKTDPELAMPM